MGDQVARSKKFAECCLCSSSKVFDKGFFRWKTSFCKEMKFCENEVQWRCDKCSFERTLCKREEITKGMFVFCNQAEEEIPETLASWCDGYTKSPTVGGQFEKYNLAVPVQAVVSLVF
jgi:hypothetical protein